MVRCCVTEDVAIDPGGARKRGTVKISSCSPQTRGGRRWPILVCQQPAAELNEELAAQEGKRGSSRLSRPSRGPLLWRGAVEGGWEGRMEGEPGVSGHRLRHGRRMTARSGQLLLVGDGDESEQTSVQTAAQDKEERQ